MEQQTQQSRQESLRISKSREVALTHGTRVQPLHLAALSQRLEEVPTATVQENLASQKSRTSRYHFQKSNRELK